MTRSMPFQKEEIPNIPWWETPTSQEEGGLWLELNNVCLFPLSPWYLVYTSWILKPLIETVGKEYVEEKMSELGFFWDSQMEMLRT